MTLIELMVVMAIMAILMALGAVGIGAIRGADVGATANVLSGAMTYLSSRAVHDNTTYRLILDLDQRRFWTESTGSDDPCARYIPEDPNAGLGNPEEAPPAAEAEGPVSPSFSKKRDALLQRKFEPETNVTAVLTAHDVNPQTSGRAAVYFYPNGQSERALIWVGGQDAKAEGGFAPELTLELHALGTVSYHNRPLDPKDFDLEATEDLK